MKSNHQNRIKTSRKNVPLVPRKYLVTFILITFLFALWGFANDITNPMVSAFKTLMKLSDFEASFVQFAFYGGYATMAIPAALFIRRFSYKKGVVMGLTLYAVGAFLFIPAAEYQQFSFFCISLYILTFGLAFLETTANPFILSLGDKETSTRRLNLAQAFNPMGSLCGMAIAAYLVLPNLISAELDPLTEKPKFDQVTDPDIIASTRLHDLPIIRNPYVAIGLIVLITLIVIVLTKMPKTESERLQKSGDRNTAMQTFRNLWKNVIYREGVFAQMCYVGAQIMTWTYIIQYAENLGYSKAEAQKCNIIAMVLFLSSRFISTFIMRYVNSRRMLTYFSIGAIVCCGGAICFVGNIGLYSLIGISFFMSLMFPTIYGISLEDVDSRDTTLGAAFLVMAIVGGAIMPVLQGAVIDAKSIMGHPAVNISFLLPMLCFCVTLAYGIHANRMLKKKSMHNQSNQDK